MRKYLILLFAAISFTFASCEKETEPGGTAVEKMAGDWWVTVEVIKNGQSLGDAYGQGYFRMTTYNTAANSDTEMWLDDGGHFWDYKLKVNVDYKTRSFSTSDFVDNLKYDSKVKITDGKILEGAALSPSGMPADSIVYFVQFDDDKNGFVHKISGFRRTGFEQDDF
ncbi:lipid-binding protein [Bacteroides sedimenti]|uniref:Lipid-binding hydrolase n=1 Tax=Bacteroides sedimenti TaxID=2136147 RepID=A0ABM8IEK3_9BACE